MPLSSTNLEFDSLIRIFITGIETSIVANISTVVVECLRDAIFIEFHTSALTSGGGRKSKIPIAKNVENKAVSVGISTVLRAVTLAERNFCLEYRALHVINEESKVTRLGGRERSRDTVVGSRATVQRISSNCLILAVTMQANGSLVWHTTVLLEGAHLLAISLRPVLDLDLVNFSVCQVRDGWCGSEVIWRSMVVGGSVRVACSKDGNVVVIVTSEVSRIDPPTANALLWIVQIKIIPCIKLNRDDAANGSGA